MDDADSGRKFASLAVIAGVLALSAALWPSVPTGIGPQVVSPRLAGAAPLPALDVIDRFEPVAWPRPHRGRRPATAAAPDPIVPLAPAPELLEARRLVLAADEAPAVAPAPSLTGPAGSDPVTRAFRTAAEQTGNAFGTAARAVRGIF